MFLSSAFWGFLFVGLGGTEESDRRYANGRAFSEGDCHDQDSKRPSVQVARTNNGMGFRRACDAVLGSVYADTRCAHFRHSGSGERPQGSPRQRELANFFLHGGARFGGRPASEPRGLFV
jgi:hypothetical protein